MLCFGLGAVPAGLCPGWTGITTAREWESRIPRCSPGAASLPQRRRTVIPTAPRGGQRPRRTRIGEEVRADMAWLFHAHNLGEYLRAVGFTAVFVTFSCVAAERNKELLRSNSDQMRVSLKTKLDARRKRVEDEIVWDEPSKRKGPVAEVLEAAVKEVRRRNNGDRPAASSPSAERRPAAAVDRPPLSDFEEFAEPRRLGDASAATREEVKPKQDEMWPEHLFERDLEEEKLAS